MGSISEAREISHTHNSSAKIARLSMFRSLVKKRLAQSRKARHFRAQAAKHRKTFIGQQPLPKGVSEAQVTVKTQVKQAAGAGQYRLQHGKNRYRSEGIRLRGRRRKLGDQLSRDLQYRDSQRWRGWSDQLSRHQEPLHGNADQRKGQMITRHGGPLRAWRAVRIDIVLVHPHEQTGCV